MELIQLLRRKKINLSELKKIKNQKRRVEWLSIREVITNIAPQNDIIYSADGKPFLSNSPSHISISHSSEMIAISLDKLHNTGVDIQIINPKITRIKEKFLNEYELSKLNLGLTELTGYWCVKEALFKIYGKKSAFLKENIEINEVTYEGNSGEATGTIKVNDYLASHRVSIKLIDNYILAYTVNS